MTSPRMTHLAPEIERLVERQLRNWELARAQHAPKRSPGKPVHDFVAISRLVGSGGADVARILAQQLGWPVFDKEVLHAMAGDDTDREQLYAWMDERDAGWLEQMLQYVVRGRFPPQDYFPRLTRTVLALARGAPAVFLGRAADLILPREHGLRVRIVAPFEQRVRRYGERNYLEQELARDEVARIDRERTQFVRHHFRCDAGNLTRCDLTINTQRVSAAEAAELVVHLLRKRGIVA